MDIEQMAREVEELRSKVQQQEEELDRIGQEMARLTESTKKTREEDCRDPRVKRLFDNEMTLHRQRYGAPII